MSARDLDIRSKDAGGGGTTPLQAFLAAHPTVEFIRMQLIDYNGLSKARVLTVRSALRLEAHGPETGTLGGLTSYMGMLSADGSLNMPAVRPGKDDLVPDWASLQPCTYEPAHATLWCHYRQLGVSDYATCPRSLLSKWERAAQADHGLSVLVGSEVEFFLHEWGPQGELVQPAPSGSSYGFGLDGLRIASHRAVIEESIRAIEAAGIETTQFHAEGGGPGIYELSLEPLAPVAAVDAMYYAREALRTCAARHGLHATFYPKPFEKASSVGAHMHLSISRGDDDDDENDMTAASESFLAGMLRHLPAIAAIGIPSFDSYDRAAFFEWVSWGDENRVSAIRRIPDDGKNSSCRWELRFLDGCANMYLALSALLAAGLTSLAEKTPLELKGREKMTLDFPESEARDLGATVRMPASLKEAVRALRADGKLREVVGGQLVDAYLQLKEAEQGKSAGMTSLERRRKYVRDY